MSSAKTSRKTRPRATPASPELRVTAGGKTKSVAARSDPSRRGELDPPRSPPVAPSASATSPEPALEPTSGPALATIVAPRGPTEPPPTDPPPTDRSPTAGPDPVPEGIRGLVALFRTELAEVRFPDVDREILESACEEVRGADAEVARLFAELEAAQVDLADKRAHLGRLAERGLAYAQVYAGEDEALTEKLGALDVGAPKKPSRKPKTSKPPRTKRVAPPALVEPAPPSSARES